MRIVEYRGGPADGKLDAVSNNNCVELLYLDPASIRQQELEVYLYKFDGFSNSGKLLFKYASKVDAEYKCKTGFGPSSTRVMAVPLRVEI